MHERVWGDKNIPDELTIHHEQHTFHKRQLYRLRTPRRQRVKE